ncbi:hypothetical protein ACQP25_13650 [Microtetraspora malaysiensis]
MAGQPAGLEPEDGEVLVLHGAQQQALALAHIQPLWSVSAAGQ